MGDYVTSKIAKKLQEKGYPMVEIPIGSRDNRNGPVLYDLPKDHPNWQNCKAWWIPTISQVLKWLRVDKEIMVFPIYSKNTSRWYCSIVNADSLAIYNFPLSDSYEQAALIGIKFTLDKLI